MFILIGLKNMIRLIRPILIFSFISWGTLSPSLVHAKTITIDTGHTPTKNGSLSANGIKEYTYNLQMSNAITYYLRSFGIEVKRTSVNEPNIKLSERATRYPTSDLFVSIHHDAIPKQLYSHRNEIAGYSIFVSKKNSNFNQSLYCSQVVGKNLQAIGEYPSTFHSLDIPGEQKRMVDPRGVFLYDNLVVLKTSTPPALLIEVGVISNPYEANRLTHAATINHIAKNIATSLASCVQ